MQNNLFNNFFQDFFEICLKEYGKENISDPIRLNFQVLQTDFPEPSLMFNFLQNPEYGTDQFKKYFQGVYIHTLIQQNDIFEIWKIERNRDKKIKKNIFIFIFKNKFPSLWLVGTMGFTKSFDRWIKRLIRYCPKIIYPWIDSDYLHDLLLDFVGEEDEITIKAVSDPLSIKKSIDLPVTNLEKMRNYYSRNKIKIHIRAPKWRLKEGLNVAKIAKADLYEVNLKVTSPNPGKTNLFVDENGGIRQGRGSMEVLSEVSDRMMQRSSTNLQIFNDLIQNKETSRSIILKLSENKSREFDLSESTFLEKIFTRGHRDSLAVFYGYLVERKGNEFLTHVFDGKFGGDFYLYVNQDSNSGKIQLSLYPTVNTSPISLELAYRTLKERYDKDMDDVQDLIVGS